MVKPLYDHTSSEIASNVDSEKLVDEVTRRKVIEAGQRNAVQYESIYEDSTIITLKMWEEAIAGIAPEEYEKTKKEIE